MKLLAEKTGIIPTNVDDMGNCILHHMAEKAMEADQKHILQIMLVS